MLNVILASLSHLEDEIREAAKGADVALRALLQQSQDAQFEMHTLLHTLAGHLSSQYVPTLLAALQWVHMLLRKSGPRVMQLSQQVPSSRLTRRPPSAVAALHGHPCHSQRPGRFPSS